MSWFSGLGDICVDTMSSISVTIGGETYDHIFTTIGEVAGGGWEAAGKVADVFTEDVNIDLDNTF